MPFLVVFALAASLITASPSETTSPTAVTAPATKHEAKPIKLPPVCDGLEMKAEGKIFLIPLEDKEGRDGGRACAFIDAKPEEAYGALTDYETFPRWMDKVEKCAADWQDETTAIVSYEIGTMIGGFNYVLDRKHYPPKRVSWTMMEGDLDFVAGSYDFYPVNGKTVLVFESFVDPGIYVPGFIQSHFREKGARRIIEDVRKEVKRRQGR